MSYCVIMIGPPGSGKSFYSAKLLAKHSDWKYISADLIREQKFGNANIQGGKDVFDELYKQIDDAVKERDSFIVDNTSIKQKYRTDITSRLTADYDTIYIVMTTWAGTCHRQNKERPRVVPEEVIDKMYDNHTKNMSQNVYDKECPNVLYVCGDKVTDKKGYVDEAIA